MGELWGQKLMLPRDLTCYLLPHGVILVGPVTGSPQPRTTGPKKEARRMEGDDAPQTLYPQR
jgi:hypothetical protein